MGRLTAFVEAEQLSLELGDTQPVIEGDIWPKELGDKATSPGAGDRPQGAKQVSLLRSNGDLRVGWMWSDHDPGRTVEEKIERAVKRYHAKFGCWPNTCKVNGAAIPGGDGFNVGRVKVVAARYILPHHFFLGVVDGRVG